MVLSGEETISKLSVLGIGPFGQSVAHFLKKSIPELPVFHVIDSHESITNQQHTSTDLVESLKTTLPKKSLCLIIIDQQWGKSVEHLKNISKKIADHNIIKVGVLISKCTSDVSANQIHNAIKDNVDGVIMLNISNRRECVSVDEKYIDIANQLRPWIEMLTIPQSITIEVEDLESFFKNGKVAIMTSGIGEGEDRLQKAITNAHSSVLFECKEVCEAKNVLIYVDTLGQLRFPELRQLNSLANAIYGEQSNIIIAVAKSNASEKYGPIRLNQLVNIGDKLS